MVGVLPLLSALLRDDRPDFRRHHLCEQETNAWSSPRGFSVREDRACGYLMAEHHCRHVHPGPASSVPTKSAGATLAESGSLCVALHGISVG